MDFVILSTRKNQATNYFLTKKPLTHLTAFLYWVFALSSKSNQADYLVDSSVSAVSAGASLAVSADAAGVLTSANGF